jgi:DGQHR domain-containing protein
MAELQNVHEREALSSIARSKARDFESKTVHPKTLEDYLPKGWVEDQPNLRSVRLKRPKSAGVLLEDRVWTLMYKLGFPLLSGERGAQLVLNPKEKESPKTQIDVVAIDEDVAVAIECKTSATFAKRNDFIEELAKHVQNRPRFAAAVRADFGVEPKRQPVFAMFLQNAELSDKDQIRAKEASVALLDENDLAYYEGLVAHLGPAAKYQFLADCLPGKPITGLGINVPAVKAKMGGHNCYTFSISPDYLLKISYVSHRLKGRASDVDTYQRMMTKSRLNKIREYINEDGIFPTNIVINLEKGTVNFEKAHQEEKENNDLEVGILGWLRVKPAYKSAWIIDGQHRLYAYSGLERAAKARVAVLAFEGLAPSKQAQLFIDINAKQKHVKQSLLLELYAELHCDSEKIAERVSAVISKAVQELGADKKSPLFGRIQTADDSKNELRCISITGLFGALDRSDLFLARIKGDEVLEYGPLWAGTNEKSFKRTVYVLREWFSFISKPAWDWWEKGSGEGGGLAMNDPIIACMVALRNVMEHLESGKLRLRDLDADELLGLIKPHGEAIGNYLANLSEDERKVFRDKRGVQGQTWRRRQYEKAIKTKFPTFNPEGLDEYIEGEKAQTTQRAKQAIDHIEMMLQRIILEELKRECGSDENEWWMVGIPKAVRMKVSQRHEDDDNKRGGKEFYFDLIDYKHIAAYSQNWPLFEPILGFGKGGKDKKLAWLDYVNEKRKLVAHASAAVVLPVEDLTRLQEIDQWLVGQLTGASLKPNSSSGEADDA